ADAGYRPGVGTDGLAGPAAHGTRGPSPSKEQHENTKEREPESSARFRPFALSCFVIVFATTMSRESTPLSARGLTRTFGKEEAPTVALHDVSLDLQPGQVTLIMGPSGSGKSTLLAVLSGLLRPDCGQVMALGQDLWRLSEPQREAFRL